MIHKIMCVVDICKGYCCKNIDDKMAKKMQRFVKMKQNSDGNYTCEYSDEKTGKCLNYKNRPKICRRWWCESALFGYMQKASIHLENPVVSKV